MILIFLAGVMRLFYYGFFLFYYRKLFPAKNARLIRTLLTATVIFLVHFFPSIRSIPMSTLPIMLIVMVVGLRVSTGMNWLQATHGGSMCLLYACCFYSIVGELCTAFSQNHVVLISTQIRLLAFPASLSFFLLLRKFFLNDVMHKKFLKNIGRHKLVIILEIIAISNLYVIYLGRFGLADIWNLEMILFASILTIGVLAYTVIYTVKSADSTEARWELKILEKQFDNQLRHYIVCQNHTKSFRAFRHDYKSLMASLKPLIAAGENEDALRLIDNIDEEMTKKAYNPKRFSRPIVLDAILQDAANICEINEISYSFHLFAFRNTGLSALNRVRILANVFNNAIEACLKTPKEDRFLKVTNRIDAQWVTLDAQNSYAGNLIFENGRPVSTKQERETHGLGLQSVHEIAEELGGFVFYNVDEEKHTFLIRIHLPKTHAYTAL